MSGPVANGITALGLLKPRADSHRLTLVAIWLVLLTVPLWLPHLGGYTALAGRVLVLGLAAMALNFLLGFTGVLSFGHAARPSTSTRPASAV